MGHLESPQWLHFQFQTDPSKHVLIQELSPLGGESIFMERVKGALAENSVNDALVFIHGFDVDFASAIRRTAQITYDLGFRGVPLAYVWPSQAVFSPIAYVRDSNASDVTVPHLRSFLLSLAAHSGATTIHIIAHSMGNKALARALERIAIDPDIAPKPVFGEIMLCAPDIDENVMKDVAQRFARIARRITLYASQNDRALIAAHTYARSRRAGEGGRDILVLPGVDSIEVSKVDTNLIGHFYYGDNRSVLSDMFYLMKLDQAPSDRFAMTLHQRGGDHYWEFTP
jgi:esterase/lipase superfamily enzyme